MHKRTTCAFLLILLSGSAVAKDPNLINGIPLEFKDIGGNATERDVVRKFPNAICIDAPLVADTPKEYAIPTRVCVDDKNSIGGARAMVKFKFSPRSKRIAEIEIHFHSKEYEGVRAAITGKYGRPFDYRSESVLSQGKTATWRSEARASIEMSQFSKDPNKKIEALKDYQDGLSKNVSTAKYIFPAQQEILDAVLNNLNKMIPTQDFRKKDL